MSTYDACRSMVITWLQPAVVSMLAISLALCSLVRTLFSNSGLPVSNPEGDVQWALGSCPSCPVAHMGSLVSQR